MTGGGLFGLILLSMAWLFFLFGLAAHYGLLKIRLHIGPLAGVVGSLAVFFTIPALARHGVTIPWPWLWILLPLALDPACLARLLGKR